MKLPLLLTSPEMAILCKWSGLLALGWAADWALRRHDARWRLILWRGILCLGLALPLAHFCQIPGLKIPIASAAVGGTEFAGSLSPVAAVHPMQPAGSMGKPPATPGAARSTWRSGNSAPTLPPSNPVPWERILLLTWALGCGVAAFRLFRLHLQLFRLRKETCRPSPELQRLAKQIQVRLNAWREVDVQVSDAVTSPFLCGLLNPAIILPRKLAQNLSPGEMCALLSHEIAHLRQNDVVWCVAWQWMKAVCWFHPLVWKAPAVHNLACEQEADRVASGQLAEQDSYAQLLARLALRLLALPEVETKLTLNGSSQIARRLNHLGHTGIGAWNWKHSAAALGLVGLLFLMTAGFDFSKAGPAELRVKTMRSAQVSPTAEPKAISATASTNESGVQLTIELRDGSQVVGKSQEDTFSFHSAMLGEMKVPWAGIRSIEIDYAGTNTAKARLTATNGDVVAIQLAADTLRVETGFGQTELPFKVIRSVKVAPPAKPNAVAGTDTAQLAIELRDGSQVVGKHLDEALNFHSSALGDFKMTWEGIRSIEYEGTNTEMARLTATNGDVYEVQFGASSVRVETSLGKTELPVKMIRSITALAAGSAAGSASLIDVAFTSLATAKVGFAATGVTNNDFWNSVASSLDTGSGARLNLKLVDGTDSGARLTVANANGGYGNGASDLMYQSFFMNLPARNITVTLANLSAGLYDFYLYGHGDQNIQNSVFQLSVAGVSQGVKATTTSANWNSSMWQEGVQYVEFTHVSVAARQTVTILVAPGASSYACLSGLQIQSVGRSSPVGPRTPARVVSP
jgi:beta-lactamase regulating signal transducer with metallopeptidase domain